MVLAKVFGELLQILPTEINAVYAFDLTRGLRVASTVKVLQKGPNNTDLSKHLASKMGSLITMKLERSSSGRDNLFQKDFSYRRGSSLSAREGFRAV